MRGEVSAAAFMMLARAGKGDLTKARDKKNHANSVPAGNALNLLDAYENLDAAMGPYDEKKLPVSLTPEGTGLSDKAEIISALLTLDRVKFSRELPEFLNELGIDQSDGQTLDRQIGEFGDLISIPFKVLQAESLVSPFVEATYKASRMVRFFGLMDDEYPEVVKAKNRVSSEFSQFVNAGMASYRSCIANGHTLEDGAFIIGIKSVEFTHLARRIAKEKEELSVQMESYTKAPPPAASTVPPSGPASPQAPARLPPAGVKPVKVNGVVLNVWGLPVFNNAHLRSNLDGYALTGDKKNPLRDSSRTTFFAGSKPFSAFIDIKSHPSFKANQSAAGKAYNTEFLKLVLGNATYMKAHPKVTSILEYAKERYTSCLNGKFPNK
jgi:hypothetical protein